MGTQRQIPQVNAGSMADIAFLLLVFFLVTTTIENDIGIHRKLPPKQQTPPPLIKENNLLRIGINPEGKLLVKNDIVALDEIQNIAIAFLDNGGATEEENYCNYCKGSKLATSSDNPQRAIIVLNAGRQVKYSIYVAVQNELNAAYTHLRNRESNRLYKQDYSILLNRFMDKQTPTTVKATLKKQLAHIRSQFPQKLSEANLK